MLPFRKQRLKRTKVFPTAASVPTCTVHDGSRVDCLLSDTHTHLLYTAAIFVTGGIPVSGIASRNWGKLQMNGNVALSAF